MLISFLFYFDRNSFTWSRIRGYGYIGKGVAEPIGERFTSILSYLIDQFIWRRIKCDMSELLLMMFVCDLKSTQGVFYG